MFLKTRRALAVATLCAFASGCASYRSVALPGTAPVDAVARPEDEVRTGDRARVTLVSGDVISGEVSAVSTDSITVGRPGNYGLHEDSVAASDIARLEVERYSSGSHVLAISVAGVLILGAAIAAAYGDAVIAGLASSD